MCRHRTEILSLTKQSAFHYVSCQWAWHFPDELDTPHTPQKIALPDTEPARVSHTLIAPLTPVHADFPNASAALTFNGIGHVIDPCLQVRQLASHLGKFLVDCSRPGCAHRLGLLAAVEESDAGEYNQHAECDCLHDENAGGEGV